MQNLVNRNEEYLKHIYEFTKSVGQILERLATLEYNIKEMRETIKHLPIDSQKDEALKEAWYAKRERKQV